MQQVGRELGVAYVLEGSVRKAGKRVRVTGQLVSCNDGSHLWAERFDRDLTDIFAIQDEITHAIVDQLKVKLLPQEKKSIAQIPTENIEAYTYYLRGPGFSCTDYRNTNLQIGAADVRAAQWNWIRNMLAPTPGLADCDSYICT